jgi:hypothetical protein
MSIEEVAMSNLTLLVMSMATLFGSIAVWLLSLF